ncbi:MAG TPA: hypothetical protein VJ023_09830 [Pyrinomonadaceae bacterium]|nr:hypothetical protein [Pyrinomonadaceae bacterium]
MLSAPDMRSADISEGLSRARSGVEQSYQAELGANKQIYITEVDADGQIRSAGFEAAKLRQAAAVIAAVGREISREVGRDADSLLSRSGNEDLFDRILDDAITLACGGSQSSAIENLHVPTAVVNESLLQQLTSGKCDPIAVMAEHICNVFLGDIKAV